jgi:hypothetical protein
MLRSRGRSFWRLMWVSAADAATLMQQVYMANPNRWRCSIVVAEMGERSYVYCDWAQQRLSFSL